MLTWDHDADSPWPGDVLELPGERRIAVLHGSHLHAER